MSRTSGGQSEKAKQNQGVSTLTDLTALACQYLTAVEDRMKACTLSGVPSVQSIVDHLMSVRGKRLRPLVAIASGMCFSEVSPALIDVACAVELVHTASLVHDDVIDSASRRRGIATVNALWGNNIAVLLGDMLLSSALNVLTPYTSCGVLSVVASAISRMCESEIDQARRAYDPDMTEADYLRRIDGKTAALLEASCVAGALVTGAPPDMADRVGKFGKCLGLAFQISDDILDFVSDSGDLGKPTCADLRQGVITLPVIYLLGDATHGTYLREALVRRSVAKRMRKIQRLLLHTGALARAKARASCLLDNARAHLGHLPESRARHALESALSIVSDRMAQSLSERDLLSSLESVLEPAPLPQCAAHDIHQT